VSCHQSTTEGLVAATPGLTTVLSLGDHQYENGTSAEFLGSYDATWGKVKTSTKPVPGNHEYQTTNATGYYGYFGSAAGDPARGYYSYDLGVWHIVALNANCNLVSCAAGSPQEAWLKADLQAHPASCTLAYWHQPRFTQGDVGEEPMVDPFWQDLYAAHADLILNGHTHAYERYALQDPNQNLAADGIRELVIGTGGVNFSKFPNFEPNVETSQATTFGIMRLTLHASSYNWAFVPDTSGAYTDSGSTACHGRGGAVPGPPGGATAAAGNRTATVNWTPPTSTGSSPITSYTVTSAPGGITATVAAPATSALVTGLTNGTSYTFTVAATNSAGTGAGSTPSNAVTPVGPGIAKLSPNTGRLAGGAMVSITGSGFTGSTAVRFGANPAVSFTVTSPTSIVAAAPSGSLGQVDVVVTTPTGPTPTSPTDKFTYSPYDHIFTILMENQDYTTIIGPGGPTYTNSLANTRGLAANYDGLAHPSLGNYLGLTAGDTFAATTNAMQDCNPTGVCVFSAPNLAANLLDPAGLSWKAYQESMPAPCALTDTSPYVVHHNPFVYYANIQNKAAECTSKVVPYTGFSTDLATAATTPNYAFITPNVNDDMHTGTVAQGDTWLSQNVPPILNSPAFTQQKSLLFIVWDEDTGSSTNHVATVVAASGAPTHVVSNTPYTHYSLLKTVETTWGLGTLTTNDQAASPMTDLVTPPPAPTLSGIVPTSGPAGTQVTVNGANLTGVTSVAFGGVAATTFSVNGAGSAITATTPAGSGAVSVSVTTPGGTASLSNAYTYTVSAPTISGVSPNAGPLSGGTPVTISGSGLNGATSVSFGGVAAAGVSVVSPSQITATTPAGSGTVSVSVTTPGGTGSLAGAYTYVAAPSLSGVSPASGPSSGATVVTISGSNLTGATSVGFGGVAATAVSVNAAGSAITATTPAGSGTVSVSVTTPGGTAGLSNAYTYTAAAFPTAAGVVFAQDSFAGRSVTGGWGTASDGHGWGLQSGSAAALSVSIGSGRVAGSGSLATLRLTLGTGSAADTEVVDRYTSSDYANDAGQVLLRLSNASTYYRAGLDSPVSGPEINIMRTTGGTETRVANVAFAAVNGASYWQRARVTTSGTTAVISVRVWRDGTAEPTTWNLTWTDTAPLPAGTAGLAAWDGGAGWAADHFSAGKLN
jgi:hypothetical protein